MVNLTIKKLSLVTLLSASILSLQGCVTAAAVGTVAAVGVATKVASDPRTAGTQIDDETIEERISFRIKKDPQLNEETRVEVVSYNGDVLLVGQAFNEDAIKNVENIARGVDGVNKIYNKIRIGQIIKLGQITKDSWITTQVKTKLIRETTVKSGDIKVFTENGEVFLIGDVTAKNANLAIYFARYTNGVRNVVPLFNLK